MNRYEIKNIIACAIKPPKLCRTYLKYDANYRYYFPLKVSDRLFLGAKEDAFILDGFSIRRFCDISKVEIKDDKCLEIDIAEGLIDNLSVPEVDITDWKSVMTSLQKLGFNIIVEKENIDEKKSDYAIGRIIDVLSDNVLLKVFDADGIWQQDLYIMPFSQITSVTFRSRYVDIFSKYLSSMPE